MKTEHILIIRFFAIGDVAMTVPVIYSLANQYPKLRITVLSRPFAKPFFEKFGFKEVGKNIIKRKNIEFVNFSMEREI